MAEVKAGGVLGGGEGGGHESSKGGVFCHLETAWLVLQSERASDDKEAHQLATLQKHSGHYEHENSLA